MSEKKRSKSLDELQKVFEKCHWEWVAVNNFKGFASGAVHKAWARRDEALDALVQANRKKKVRDV